MFDADIRDKYSRAKQLFKDGRIAEADRLLEELDQAYPNHPDILYGRVRCLGKLGRIREARILANKMQTMHNDTRAPELQAWLKRL